MSYCHNYCIFSGVLICRSVFKGSLVISWLGKTGTGTRRCSLGWEQTRGWGLGAGGSTGDAPGSCMDMGCHLCQPTSTVPCPTPAFQQSCWGRVGPRGTDAKGVRMSPARSPTSHAWCSASTRRDVSSPEISVPEHQANVNCSAPSSASLNTVMRPATLQTSA